MQINYSTNMMLQPEDIPHCTFDHDFFESLDAEISVPGDSQLASSKPDMNPNQAVPPQPNKFLEMSEVGEVTESYSNTYPTPILAPCYTRNESSSSILPFDESEMWNFDGPINEIIIRTTPSYAETQNNTISTDGTSIEPNPDTNYNLTLVGWESLFKEAYEQENLRNIDSSIQERTMSIETQPPENLRPRYKTDGKRQIEKSRTKPMTIKLPQLSHIQLDPNEKLLLRLALTTSNQNSLDAENLHMNKLEYHSDDVEQLLDGSVAVLIPEDRIKEGKMPLPRLSIVRTKLAAYKAQLIPYNLTGINNQLHVTTNVKMPIKQAKEIFKQYNLEASRISCQLLIKQNESIHFTNITGQTHVIQQKEQRNYTNKRKTDAIDSDEDERPRRSKSKKSKRH